MTQSFGTGLPRWFEALAAILGLMLASPIIALACLAILLSSRGPVFFKQSRMGRGGHSFTMYKLRTMVCGKRGHQVTAQDDPRITAVGRVLRMLKIDELPEFWNVAKGDLSLVGPRPEVPYFVDLNLALWKNVLMVRPGLTDPVTLRLRNEEALLQSITTDRENFYRNVLMPYKLHGYLNYLNRRTMAGDIKVLMNTVIVVLLPSRFPPPAMDEILSAANMRD